MDYIKINKESWDKRTKIHVSSKFYDVEGFLSGQSSLQEVELNGVGDVTGKSLLHLQCHFGLDTLSWARLGAKVTGVDLSSEAIEQANLIAKKAGLEAHFICSDLYSFGDISQQQHDIVFTSYGAICWLPDLDKWAQIIAASLKPAGMFYIAESHPFYDVLSGYPYFHSKDPDVERESTYTENDTGELTTIMTWAHPISEVVNALIKAGIQIDELNEYPYFPYNCYEGMEERQPGKFSISHEGKDIPLLYTIKGTKRADG